MVTHLWRRRRLASTLGFLLLAAAAAAALLISLGALPPPPTSLLGDGSGGTSHWAAPARSSVPGGDDGSWPSAALVLFSAGTTADDARDAVLVAEQVRRLALARTAGPRRGPPVIFVYDAGADRKVPHDAFELLRAFDISLLQLPPSDAGSIEDSSHSASHCARLGLGAASAAASRADVLAVIGIGGACAGGAPGGGSGGGGSAKRRGPAVLGDVLRAAVTLRAGVEVWAADGSGGLGDAVGFAVAGAAGKAAVEAALRAVSERSDDAGAVKLGLAAALLQQSRVSSPAAGLPELVGDPRAAEGGRFCGVAAVVRGRHEPLLLQWLVSGGTDAVAAPDTALASAAYESSLLSRPRTYPPLNATAAEPNGVVSECRVLVPGSGLRVSTKDWGNSHKSVLAVFRAAYEAVSNDAAVLQRLKLRQALADLKPYDHQEAGVSAPGSRGVVMTASRSGVADVLFTAFMLRETGCTLPIEFAYAKFEVDEQDLDVLRAHNIRPVETDAFVRNARWAPTIFALGQDAHVQTHPIRLGASKVFALLASSFEQILFLDQDNSPIVDPTFLFETNAFARTGALFWPDFPVRKSPEANPLWWYLGLQERYRQELEFESGQMVLDKSKIWGALQITAHISLEANYYFQYFLGDKEAFFWAFTATGTPYFLNPNYITSVGALVNSKHPDGEPTLDASQALFCGLSMMQSGFHDEPRNLSGGRLPAKDASVPANPLFMHWNIVKRIYNHHLDFFQTAQMYVVPRGKEAADFRGVNYLSVHESVNTAPYKYCLFLKPGVGLDTTTYNFRKRNPDFNARFHTMRAKAHRAIELSRLQADMERIGNYSRVPAEPGSRGIVMVGKSDDAVNAVAAAIGLRRTGCKLPIRYAYLQRHSSLKNIEMLRNNKIDPHELPDMLGTKSWSDTALMAAAALDAPFERVLVVDAATYFVSDPDVAVLNRTDLFDGDGGGAAAVFWGGRRARSPQEWDEAAAAVGLADLPFRRGALPFAGAAVFHRPKAWRAIATAAHYLQEKAHFFQTTNTTLRIMPWRPRLVGAMVPIAPDRPVQFCGQGVVLESPTSGVDGGTPLLVSLGKIPEDFRNAAGHLATVASYPATAAADPPVLEVKGAGWTDLGTAGQLKDCLVLKEVAQPVEFEYSGTFFGRDLDAQYRVDGRSARNTVAKVRFRKFHDDLLSQPEDDISGGSGVMDLRRIAPPFGVVLVETRGGPQSAVLTARLLRALGCDLPVFFAHVSRARNDDELKAFQTLGQLGVGLLDGIPPDAPPALKVLRALAFPEAPQLALVMDAATLPLRDPTPYLKAMPSMARGAAAFWPDLDSARAVAADGMADVVGLDVDVAVGASPAVVRARPGLAILDKVRAGLAFKVVEHLVLERPFYERHVGSYDPLYWGFAAFGPQRFFVPGMQPVGVALTTEATGSGGSGAAPACLSAVISGGWDSSAAAGGAPVPLFLEPEGVVGPAATWAAAAVRRLVKSTYDATAAAYADSPVAAVASGGSCKQVAWIDGRAPVKLP
ncbi:hypothetical protein HK405_004479, partial [Cladochytrium tenue]